MALTAFEELTIVNGEVRPDAATLDELVHQVGTQFAEDFMKSYKIFPTDDGGDPPLTINQEATSYLNKMLSTCSQMYRANGIAIDSLKRIVVVLLGELAPDYDFVLNMDDDIWENFVGLTIEEAFELSGNVRQEEKTAYNAI